MLWAHYKHYSFDSPNNPVKELLLFPDLQMKKQIQRREWFVQGYITVRGEALTAMLYLAFKWDLGCYFFPFFFFFFTGNDIPTKFRLHWDFGSS